MTQIPFHAVRDWLYRDALPFWALRGIDDVHGGFLEELSSAGAPTKCAFKRVRVQCRQTYVFSHAAVLDWPAGEALSHLGFEYLRTKARLGDEGWARVLSRSGAVIDGAPDLYDLAFVLFASAWRYRACGEAWPLKCAHEVLDFIEERMAAPLGGYWPALPATEVILQNPLMHLTEACLGAYEATRHERFLDKAGELVGLFRTKLFDGRTLAERFTPDWRRLSSDQGCLVEPGHHFEWAWILAQYQRLTGEDVADEARALAHFAERCGVDQSCGAVYDAITDGASLIRSSSRLWTNTERIKAYLALFELTGRDPTSEICSSLSLIFERYFANARRGLWVDHFDCDGRPISTAVPASIVYHLFLAFQELLRLEPALKASRLALEQPLQSGA